MDVASNNLIINFSSHALRAEAELRQRKSRCFCFPPKVSVRQLKLKVSKENCQRQCVQLRLM